MPGRDLGHRLGPDLLEERFPGDRHHESASAEHGDRGARAIRARSSIPLPIRPATELLRKMTLPGFEPEFVP